MELSHFLHLTDTESSVLSYSPREELVVSLADAQTASNILPPDEELASICKSNQQAWTCCELRGQQCFRPEQLQFGFSLTRKRFDGSQQKKVVRLLLVFTCHCCKMVEATPDPAHTHRRVEVRASEQRLRNHLWSRRLRQLWSFSQNAIAPNKHLTLFWKVNTNSKPL